MKIDASRFRLFLSNPEEYRLKEIWGHVPEGGSNSTRTLGRRRGTAFHELNDGVDAEELDHLGEDALAIAKQMAEKNREYDEKTGTEYLWREREFDIPIPDSPHRMVGKIDSRVRRYEEEFILDTKTTKHRTKADMQSYRDGLYLSPQSDFYMIAEDLRKFVYRILWKKPATSKNGQPTIEISELEVFRQGWELKAFQRAVHMVCETIEFWKREFGVEKPWPRALKFPIGIADYPYAPLYCRNMYEGAEYEGFGRREEHLQVLREVTGKTAPETGNADPQPPQLGGAL